MALQELFSNLGLEKNEADTYLTLLELGEATVLQISKKTAVKRPTLYLVLRSLEEKGYASRIVRGKKSFFSPQHPQKLLTEAELRMKELKEAVPQLESLFHKASGRPRIMIYEGKDALDRAYDEWFLVKGEMAYMGTLQLSMGALPRTYKKMEWITLSPEFSSRELIADSPEAQEYVKKVSGPYRQIRFLPKEFLPFESDIGIFGSRVLITSVKKEYFTVSIESEEISHAFRNIFDVMWQRGETS